MRDCLILCVSAIALVGCTKTTTSFAPPKINEADIKRDIEGARQLIRTYKKAYGDAAADVADGRQYFEVPALAVALGGATAAALGAGADVAIVAGAAAAGLTSAKNYYAPRDKLPILLAGSDAINCVSSVSQGVDPISETLIEQAADDKKAGALKAAPAVEAQGTSVAINATDQYFTAVESALGSIHVIAAQRLGSIGNYAPDALVSEIKAAAAATSAKEDELKDEAQRNAAASEAAAVVGAAKPGVDQNATDNKIGVVEVEKGEALVKATIEAKAKIEEDPSIVDEKQFLKAKLGDVLTVTDEDEIEARHLTDEENSKLAAQAEKQRDVKAVSETLLYIRAMQPKLQECVVRAKL